MSRQVGSNMSCSARNIAVALAVVLFAAAAASGCTSTTAGDPATPAAQGAASGSGDMSAVTAALAPDVQTCSACGGKGAAPTVAGKATLKSGVQVLSVGFVGGYYSPNTFTVSAGTPVEVAFAGKAAKCLAKPKFPSLGKSADVTTSGAATIDLGALEPGVYEFTCGMGMKGGTITVQ